MSDDTSFHAVLPRPTAVSAPFWDGCDRGVLLLRHCEACGARTYYPRLMCPACGSRDVTWQEASGRGTVYALTRVEMSFYGSDWESDLPYVVALVDLEEGPRIVSRCVRSDRDELHIGAAVRITYLESEGRSLPFIAIERSEP
jgi:uncharacterized protein